MPYHRNQIHLQSERDRNNLRMVGLHTKFLRKNEEAMALGLEILGMLKDIEEQLTLWEDTQDLATLEKLPWWEARQEYRKQKALGNVPEVTWYEAASFFERSHPKRYDSDQSWGLVDQKKLPHVIKRKARDRLERERRLEAALKPSAVEEPFEKLEGKRR